MGTLVQIAPERLLLLLGLSFFFGMAFEEHYGELSTKPPGGVRTFPLLAFSGAGLFILEPQPAHATRSISSPDASPAARLRPSANSSS